jgi:RNA polymerase sigma-70 factor (ECF subfamily)
MLRVRDDDAEAFKELVMNYQSRMLRVMESWIGSKDSAEELVQDVFLRVYRARHRYEPTAKFSTWLFRIANNVARNAVRDRSRRHEYQLAARDENASGAFTIEEIAKDASGLMPARTLDRLEATEIVRLAVQSLGHRQRMAMVLCKFEGMSYQEIAETMELSEKAIKSLLSRARVNLKSILQPYVDSGQLPIGISPSNDSSASQGGT